MQPGLVNYKDVQGGVGNITRESIDKSMQSFMGRPFVIKHEPISDETGKPIDPVTPDNMKEVSKGYITRVYWGEDGWMWFDGICDDEEAKQLARPKERGGKGWGISCCYQIVGIPGPAGKLNGVPFDFEVKEFNGEHLALHPAPRYTGSRIIMNGQSTASTSMNVIKFVREKLAAAAGAAPVVEAAAAAPAAGDKGRIENGKDQKIDIKADTPVTINGRDGKPETVPFGELVESHLTLHNGVAMDADQEIEYAEGKRQKFGVMCAHYANAMDMEEKAKKEEDDKKNGISGIEDMQKREILGATTTGVGGMSLNFTPTGDGRPKNAAGAAAAPAKEKTEGAEPARREGDRSPHVIRLLNASEEASDRGLLARIGRKPESQQGRIDRARERWGNPVKMALGSGTKN